MSKQLFEYSAENIGKHRTHWHVEVMGQEGWRLVSVQPYKDVLQFIWERPIVGTT